MSAIDVGAARRIGVRRLGFALCAALAVGTLISGCQTAIPQATWSPPPSATWAKPITLQQAVGMAQDNDISASEWCAREKMAQADLTTAKTLPNPIALQTWEDVGLRDSAGKNLLLRQLDFTYPLFFWWTRPKEISSAEAGIRKEHAGIADDKRALKKAVGETFYKVLAEQDLVKITAADVKAAQDLEEAAKKKMEIGEGSGFETERAASERIAAERDHDLAQRTLAIDQLTFAFQLGADRPAWPSVASEWPPELKHISTKTRANPTDQDVNRALACRPDYAKAVAAREQAEEKLQLERRKSLALSDATGMGGLRDTADGHSKIYTLGIPLPIFNQNHGGIQKAESELAAAQADEEKIRREVIADVAVSTGKKGLAASQSYAYAQPLLEKKQAIFDDGKKLFDAGELSYTDLQQSYRDMLASRRVALETKRDAAIASWNLKIAAGN